MSKEAREAQLKKMVDSRITVVPSPTEGIVLVRSNDVTVRSIKLSDLIDKVGEGAVLVKLLMEGQTRTIGPKWLRRVLLGLQDDRPEEVQQLHHLLYQ